MKALPSLVARLFAVLVLALGLTAQCALDWQPGVAISGPSGRVTAVTNLPNGDLVVGGWFAEAGPVVASHIARWDGSQWHALGAGLNDNVYAMVVAPNGDLVVAGNFTQAGGATADRVARWDGVAWSPLGLGLDGVVNCLEYLPTGQLVAGGTFQTSGGVSMPLVAQWNGSSWAPLGTGVTGGEVKSMAVSPNGDLVIGGVVQTAGGVPVQHVARWDGTSWSGFPFQSLIVDSVAFAPNGDLAIAGLLGIAPVTLIGVFDGTTLTPISVVGTSSPSPTGRLLYDSNGDLLVVASQVLNGYSAVSRWDGVAWSQVGGVPSIVPQLLYRQPSGELLLAGGSAGDLSAFAQTLSSFDGTNWNTWGTVPRGMQGYATDASGELFGGSASGAFGPSAVNRWNGSQWSAVGPAIAGVAVSIATLVDGGLLVGGRFPNGASEEYALHWDGLTWQAISAGISSMPFTAAQGPDGTLYLGGYELNGSDSVLAYDGVQWQAVGAGLTGSVLALGFLPNGDLLAAGSMRVDGGPDVRCVRFDGSTWSTFGAPLNAPVYAMVVQADGSVVCAGAELQPAQHVVSGTGGSWSPVGGGFDRFVRSLVQMPNGDLLATGAFTTAGGVPAGRVARWDGSNWHAVGQGANEQVDVAGISRTGDLFVSGSFTRIDGVPSASMGRAIGSCPAQVSSYGNGCIGPAGPVVLAARNAPWSGATYRVRAYGMPSSGVAVHVIGAAMLQQSLPALLPQSLSGCSLLATADILDLVVPVAGIAEPSVRLPSAPALVGATFYQQVLAVQINTSFQVLTVSSSNALAATIGFF